jgi:DNA-binding SARP family transcriptional activator
MKHFNSDIKRESRAHIIIVLWPRVNTAMFAVKLRKNILDVRNASSDNLPELYSRRGRAGILLSPLSKTLAIG